MTQNALMILSEKNKQLIKETRKIIMKTNQRQILFFQQHCNYFKIYRKTNLHFVSMLLETTLRKAIMARINWKKEGYAIYKMGDIKKNQ